MKALTIPHRFLTVVYKNNMCDADVQAILAGIMMTNQEDIKAACL